MFACVGSPRGPCVLGSQICRVLLARQRCVMLTYPSFVGVSAHSGRAAACSALAQRKRAAQARPAVPGREGLDIASYAGASISASARR